MDGLVQRGRRDGVSAEQTVFTKRTKGETRKLDAPKGADANKDAVTKAMLHDAINHSILFSGMTSAQHELIVDVMVSIRTQRHDVIIRQGEALTGGDGDNFYVVGEGNFDIHRDRSLTKLPDGASQKYGLKEEPQGEPQGEPLATGDGAARASTSDLVQQRKPGDAFGELALMYSCPRQATVTCASDSAVLWALPRKLYRDVAASTALDSIDDIAQTLKSVDLLSGLDDGQFNKIIDSFEMLNFQAGDRIVQAGTIGSSFYIILQGSVDRINQEGKVEASLGRCDYFGERALLKDEPHMHHTDATTAVTLAKITRGTFVEVLGPLSAIMETAFTKRVLQRVPILRYLSTSELERMLAECIEVQYEPQQTIIKQGELGDTFFIVKEGTVNCFVNDKQVRTYNEAEYFGERALLKNEPRAADCIAGTRVSCVTLSKESFEALLGPLQQVLDHNIMKDTLRTAPLFRYLTSAERETVLNGFEFLEFQEGELIFRQGTEGLSFILIREGLVKLFHDGEEIGQKKDGEHLGEKSLLYGVPREFDAVVSSKTCHCAFLDQRTFIECMGPIADVLQRATEVVNMADLEEHRLLGVGTFGKVKLVRDKTSNRVFAMKIISKAKVIQYNQQEHIMSEKTILAEMDHPFIIQLMATFKDDQRLFMVLEYCPGGELFTLLQNERKLKDSHCTFYAASVMLAFEYMHELNVIYRDLKPENLLLDARGFCKVCDFGFAKRIVDRTWTLCGTPEYLAPETIRSKGHGKGVDWWALGILIYEMGSGFPPYCGDNAMMTYKLILEGALEFPKGTSDDCRDIVRKLLHPAVTKRLGCLRNGGVDVRLHRWFGKLNMQMLLRMKFDVPFVPLIKDVLDTSNFPHYDEMPDDFYEEDGSGWDKDF